MSMTTCQECGGQISTKAPSCPHCGLPLSWQGARGVLPMAGAALFALGVLGAVAVSQPRSQAPAVAAAPPPASTTAEASPPTMPDARPAPGAARHYVKSRAANIRNGPSTDEKILAVANRGEALSILEAQNDWLKVSVDQTGRIGWIHASLVAEDSRL